MRKSKSHFIDFEEIINKLWEFTGDKIIEGFFFGIGLWLSYSFILGG